MEFHAVDLDALRKIDMGLAFAALILRRTRASIFVLHNKYEEYEHFDNFAYRSVHDPNWSGVFLIIDYFDLGLEIGWRISGTRMVVGRLVALLTKILAERLRGKSANEPRGGEGIGISADPYRLQAMRFIFLKSAL